MDTRNRIPRIITCLSILILSTNLLGYKFTEMTVYGASNSKNSNDDQVIDRLSQDIKMNPNAATVYVARGMAYKVLKEDLDRAFSDFNQAIRIDQECGAAYFFRGSIYQLKGKYDAAINDFSKALQIQPKNSEAYFGRGISYLNKAVQKSSFLDEQNYDTAINDFSKGIALDPNTENLSVYAARSFAYHARKRYAEAWADVHKAESLGFKMDPEFIRNLRRDSGRDR